MIYQLPSLPPSVRLNYPVLDLSSIGQYEIVNPDESAAFTAVILRLARLRDHRPRKHTAAASSGARPETYRRGDTMVSACITRAWRGTA